jgi:hypothetical protein
VSVLDRRTREVRDDPLEGFTRESYRTLQSKMRDSRGFFRLPGQHGPQRVVDRPGPENIVHGDWDRWIRAIAVACGNVPLLIQFTPIAGDTVDARDFRQLEEWSRGVESSHPNVRVARPIILPYAATLMWDPIHLNAAGVEKFMPVVAEDVQALLVGVGGTYDLYRWGVHPARPLILANNEAPRLAGPRRVGIELPLEEFASVARAAIRGGSSDFRRGRALNKLG